jgi:hypothetical protein
MKNKPPSVFEKIMIMMEKVVLVFVASFFRSLFILYRLLILALILTFLLVLPVYLFFCPLWPHALAWYTLFLLAFGLAYLTLRPNGKKDNPYRNYVGLTGWFDAHGDQLIAWIGTLKFFTSPLGLVEDPGSYKIRGGEIRELIDSVLQPGDILLRGYDGYLDGVLIRMTGDSQGLGAYFSHAALYLGDLGEEDRHIVARRLQVLNDNDEWVPAPESSKEALRNDPEYFQPGRQRVVHSMTKGVFVEDILTFLRCDYLIVLRLPDTFSLNEQERELDQSLISDLPADAAAIRDKLMRGEPVNKVDILEAVRKSALGKIGSCYDFQFNDIKTGQRFSCSEFVYYCYKSIHCYLGLHPKDHSFLKILFKRNTITPADIYDVATGQGKLHIEWVSKALRTKKTSSAAKPPA